VSASKILVAGIGNVFMGDDGFGVEVVARMDRGRLPEGVEVADYGIRGFDLAYALMDGYDAVILVDAVPRGQRPGTVCVLEPELESLSGPGVLDSHGMNPMEVFRLVGQLGGTLPTAYVVGCEPAVPDADAEESMELSPPVEAAVEQGVQLVEQLVARLAGGKEGP
jgi:hydrogenase maturation protease